jgi:hypothetical protein
MPSDGVALWAKAGPESATPAKINGLTNLASRAKKNGIFSKIRKLGSHKVVDTHPRTLGVRSVVKRNQPTRLNLAPPHVGTGLDGYNLPSHLPSLRDVAAQPVVIQLPRRSLRHWFGKRLIAWGTALIGSAKYPLGQPGQ